MSSHSFHLTTPVPLHFPHPPPLYIPRWDSYKRTVRLRFLGLSCKPEAGVDHRVSLSSLGMGDSLWLPSAEESERGDGQEAALVAGANTGVFLGSDFVGERSPFCFFEDVGDLTMFVSYDRMCSGPVADPGHPRMARATHGYSTSYKIACHAL